MTTQPSRPHDGPPADPAPADAQNPDDPQPESGAHSPGQAAGEASDGDGVEAG